MISQTTTCPPEFPEHLWGGFKRYVMRGIQPGQFLMAFFEGDFHELCRRGGKDLVMELWPAVVFLHNDCPGGCFGSEGNVKEWLERGGLDGINGPD